MAPDTSDTETQAGWAPKSWFAAQLSEENAAAYFGHKINGYQQFRHASLINMLNKITGNLRRSEMLDVGCATGTLTEEIRNRYQFVHAIGMDFIPEVLALGRKEYPEIDFFEGTLPKLPFTEERFNLIVASEVLYYLTPEAQKRAIESFQRVLLPGGYLLMGSALGGDYFTPETARKMLEPHFSIVEETAFHMRCYHAFTSPFYFATRLDSLLQSGQEPGSDAMKARFKRYRSVISSPLVRLLIRILALGGRPILRSTWLPALFDRISRRTAPSNITLLGRRR